MQLTVTLHLFLHIFFGCSTYSYSCRSTRPPRIHTSILPNLSERSQLFRSFSFPAPSQSELSIPAHYFFADDITSIITSIEPRTTVFLCPHKYKSSSEQHPPYAMDQLLPLPPSNHKCTTPFSAFHVLHRRFCWNGSGRVLD